MSEREASGRPEALLSELWTFAARSEDLDTFREQAVVLLAGRIGGGYAGFVCSRKGRWTPLAEFGSPPSGWRDLAAEAADRGEPVVGRASAVVLKPEIPELLLLGAPCDDETLSRLAQGLNEIAESLHRSAQLRRQVVRQARVLELARRWSRSEHSVELLSEIAKAATELLGADRASIFLWDPVSHTLVARPALGVPGGELRLPDNQGVVGHVVQTGRTVRIDADSPQAEMIDRQTDKRLDYRTRNLLCVPLVSTQGDTLGAFEILNKLEGDFTDEDVELLTRLAEQAAAAIENVRDRERLLDDNRQLADEAASRIRLIGDSPVIAALRSTVERVARTDLAVLILGENGTGKEVVARMIHYYSDRRNKPFVAINCAAIPESLAESELFGHEQGAFTDARSSRAGKFELADQGTLFLDEIAELPISCQAKLLRVLEEKMFVRVGGSLPMKTDARLIAATNQDLGRLVREKRFREDLYFRLCVVKLDLPPLRERGGDIIQLAEYFLRQFSQRAGRPTPVLTEAAKKKLLEHTWPGNVRELRNLMERLAYLSPKETVDADDIAFILTPGNAPTGNVPPNLTLQEATDLFQRAYIVQVLRETGGNIGEAADRLGLHRSNLYRKMRKFEIEP